MTTKEYNESTSASWRRSYGYDVSLLEAAELAKVLSFEDITSEIGTLNKDDGI